MESELAALLSLPEGVELYSLVHQRYGGEAPYWSLYLSYDYDYRTPSGQNYIGVGASGRGATLAEAREAAILAVFAKRREADEFRARQRPGPAQGLGPKKHIDLSDLGL